MIHKTLGTGKILTNPSDYVGKNNVEKVWVLRDSFDDDGKEASDKEKKLIEAFSEPATKDTILAHLMKTSVHLRVEGAGKNDSEGGNRQSAIILYDYTCRLFEHKVLEADLFLALDFFIEHGDSDFFPKYNKLHKQIFGKAEK